MWHNTSPCIWTLALHHGEKINLDTWENTAIFQLNRYFSLTQLIAKQFLIIINLVYLFSYQNNLLTC
uniref:Uncharacterized protein n=1 Tax=Arundo donax TaxID=35708 RepID=A0A0A9AA97_ARUDO